MSLIEFDPTLCIALAPQQVSLALRKGLGAGTGFDPASAWHQACENNPEGLWQNALGLLRTGLQEAKELKAGTKMHITLASRWCPMLRLPWSDALMRDSAAQRFVQNQFLALYGDVSREWHTVIDDAPYGRPRLACAIEQSLLQALQQLAQDFHCQLAQVEPLVSCAWRASSRLVGKQGRALAIIEADRLNFAQIEAGRIFHVHSEYWNNAQAWPQALRQSWQRACLREPQLAELEKVAVLNLSGQANRIEVASPFHLIQLANPDLAPGYAALVCQR